MVSECSKDVDRTQDQPTSNVVDYSVEAMSLALSRIMLLVDDSCSYQLDVAREGLKLECLISGGSKTESKTCKRDRDTDEIANSWAVNE